MNNQNSDIKIFRNRLTEFLRKRHLRKTPERYAILEKALELSGHFGVDTLYNAMEEEGYHVSRATLYNTLELLCEAGILNRHRFDTNQALYEVARGSHLHLICRRCGNIRELADSRLANHLFSADYGGFFPEYSSTVVYGLCSDCAKDQDK